MKIPDWLLYGGLAVGGYLAYKEGLLNEPIAAGQKLIDDLFAKLGTGKGGTGGGGTGGGDDGGEDDSNGGEPTPSGGGAATGQCTSGPYKSSGKVMNSTQRGPTTRHYSSGKPDDKTIEKNVTGISFKNYQFVVYVTMKSIEHDDNVSIKLGGRHMNGGWYDHGVSFKGQTCLGTEKKHPSTNACVVKGKNVGSILNKKVGVAGVMINGKTEIWTDTGTGGWQLGASAMNPDGFKQLSGNNEAQLRIDGWKQQPDIHCAIVQEITAAAGSFAPTTQAKLAQNYDDFRSRQYQLMATQPSECGFMCSYETTNIPEMQAIQRMIRP